ncbi:MAG: aconitate hydratase AcnA [Anaerolinea sp.]|nr:aconitate hydratase AcnA [Anaerolinea sp.]
MADLLINPFSPKLLSLNDENYLFYPLLQVEDYFSIKLSLLPYCIRILLESAIRYYDGETITDAALEALARWSGKEVDHGSFPFIPGRILLQDLTGVPLVVDLASLRSAVARMGNDPSWVNPVIPVDLVIDHSIQVDHYGSHQALALNTALEYSRNSERYSFLKWAQGSIQGFRVIPPASGIVHQVNLEYLAQVTMTVERNGATWVFPDSVYGTDSHTTMVSGMGVLGWGVGGIEAAAAMLGQPVEILIPDVVGVQVTGKLPEGASPTDIVLTLTNQLRQLGVVNKIVEFFGSGVDELTIPDRAMLANMAPEYGATTAYFPVDMAVIRYLRLTGRSAEHTALVKAYFKAQGLFRSADSPIPAYSQVVELALDKVEPSMAGPKRPQDIIPLRDVSSNFTLSLTAPSNKRGFALSNAESVDVIPAEIKGQSVEMDHGFVAIAAITSCTNTSNPFALISAGLLAKKAVSLGLRSQPYVKTSLAPGSRAVTAYLQQAGLLEPLEVLGFHITGYGCTTCIGNSGPLDAEVASTIQHNKLIAASVLSGNRNFEGRVHPLVQANYLASPALVVAYAILGSINKDILATPLGFDMKGNPVFLKDIWPTNHEVQKVIQRVINKDIYYNTYAHIMDGDQRWQDISANTSLLYPWDDSSSYIRESPFCSMPSPENSEIKNARILAIFGDSITTDHISPAGAIHGKSAAANYLSSLRIAPADFITYGSRRGNHEVMMRATFANIRLKNLMLPDMEGSFTLHQPGGKQMSIYEASEHYRKAGIDLVVIAGKEYGTGSSRDWAAKGPLLLGVKAIIAETFERIHRSNLLGMGILPLQFKPGENAAILGLDGTEEITLAGLDTVTAGSELTVSATKPDGRSIHFKVSAMLNSSVEVQLWQSGGILISYMHPAM